MQCRDAHEVLNVLVDGEEIDEQQHAAALHVAGCSLCTNLAKKYRRIAESLRAVAYVSAPADLERKVRARLAAEAQSAPRRWHFDARRWMRQAAALIIATALSALASWYLTRSAEDAGRLEREVLAAHIRSLLQDTTIQIASSERHVVRPWFNGRVEFAPSVRDLAAQNFILLGGRLDWIDGRRVATLVYRRRLHIINIFMWPSDARTNLASRATGSKGYNAISWTKSGITHWAVSDLNAAELAELLALF